VARLIYLTFGWLHHAVIALAVIFLSPAPSKRGKQVKLLVRLDEFGDAVLTTSMVSAWAGGDPSSVLVVAPHLWAPVYSLVPGVRVLTMPARSKQWRRILAPIDAVRMGRRIRSTVSVECAIIPRSSGDTSWAILVAVAAGSHRRIGFRESSTARRQLLNRGMDCALTEKVSRTGSQHELDDLALLLHAAGAPVEGCLKPKLSAHRGPSGALLLASVGIETRGTRIAAILPSAGNYPLKAWPIELVAGTWRRLTDAGFAPVMLGSRADAPLAEMLSRELGQPIPSLAGRTTVEELAAVLTECAVAIGADTGAMHLAAALGLPTVGLYGPTNAEQFALRGHRATVLQELLPCSAIHSAGAPDRCRRCIYDVPRCMLALTPDRVMHAILKPR